MSHFDHELDTSGLNCPLPLLKTKKALSTMKTGERLRLIATDRGAFIDIPVYCEMSEHQLVDTTETENKLLFIIEKGGV
ncbi:sulfurtransferase TusA family protein [Methylophaga nitratireducenticrescens]|uniref:sulfurtransferase TusA family protein n=1 Tax=Methylophaga nitratireducenticrescens TaxID=754476 RepID=UPI000CDCCE00|nr:sulfurtransferase TusA family protein [Methylophaga nitratireducenticrescens]AUZ85829.1 response regulator SirA [Methylophaga nitratireducenticrescens]